MKKNTVLLFGCFLLAACEQQYEVNEATQITVITDNTDRLTLLPVAGPILRLYDFNVGKNKEAFFQISSITDKRLNPAMEYHLRNGSMTEKDNSQDDAYYREKLLLSYYSHIEKAVEDFNSKSLKDSSLKNSECFSTIASELQLMVRNHAEQNFLLVFSDLQEKSDLYNCYQKSSQELLYKNPSKVLKLFNDKYLLPEHLNGFEIYFVYQPKNREDDKRFNAMVDIYKNLLERRGALVKVQANNNQY